MAEADEEALAERVEADLQHAVCDVIAKHKLGMVTRWLALVEIVDDEGQRGMWTFTSEGMQTWDSLGLLHCAVHREQAQMIKQELEDGS